MGALQATDGLQLIINEQNGCWLIVNHGDYSNVTADR